jgi:TatD DNase family protein
VLLCDTHCHLNFVHYSSDLAAVLERSRSAGLIRILVPAIDLESCQEVLTLSEKDPLIFAAIGVHPNSGRTWNRKTLAELRRLAEHPRVVAIGEIGLDYYRDHTPRDFQREILQQQLDLAFETNLPVVLHVRNQSEDDRSCMVDLFAILGEWIGKAASPFRNRANPPGVVHSFSGNLQESQKALELGFYLGVTGPVTYKNSHMMREVVKAAPLDKLLIETDGPFLTPHPIRGKRNEPAHVSYIVDKISEIIGQPSDLVADRTTANAADLFKWE